MRILLWTSMLALVLLLSFLLVTGATITSRPSSFDDSQSVTVDEANAYDAVSATFANMTPTGSANLTYLSFSASGIGDSDVKRLDLIFDIQVNNLSDDQWALEYSNNSGTTWYALRALAGGNQSRANLTYQDVAGPLQDWNQSSISKQLRVRVRYQTTGAADPLANIFLHEIWANVTIDAEGPLITLVGPANNTNYSSTTLVNFSYNASDVQSNLTNCTLFLNSIANETNTSPSETATNNFSVSMDNGRYNWTVQCYDNASSPNWNESARWVVTIDTSAPVLTPLAPGNGSTLSGGSTVTFHYAFSDLTRLQNCSLYLNGTLNQTREGADVNWPSGEGEFLVQVDNGVWDWYINCTDIYGYEGTTGTSNFTQDANDAPRVHDMLISNPINLVLGNNKTVWCNASVTDSQGQGTIDTVTAYLHRSDWPYDRADETSGHHTSASCSSAGVNATTLDYQCSFDLPYYARAMNWTCTYVVNDTQSYIGVGSNMTVVEPLYAFNLTPQYIAYGAILAGDTSGEQSVTVQNLGNAELDMALDGYAQSDGDGFAMICDVGNTTIGNERYSVTSGLAWAVMTPLTDNATQVDPFNLPPRNGSFNGEAAMYWRIQLGIPQKGNCSGFVTFTGLAS